MVPFNRYLVNISERFFPKYFQADGHMSFRTRLKELRAAAGLTQQELADRAEISITGLRSLEQGDMDPKFSTVLKLALALGVDCKAFEYAVDSQADSEPAPEPEPPPQPTQPKKPKKGKKK